LKYGKKPPREKGVFDPDDFWDWIKNGVKLAEAQDRTHTVKR
jgi:hypothetical protein